VLFTEWELTPVTYSHTVLDGWNPVEMNSDDKVNINPFYYFP